MSPARWERYIPLTGILAVVLWVVGISLFEGGDTPDDDATPEQVLAYFQDDSGTIVAGGFVFMLGVVAFFWFLGFLRSRLQEAEGGLLRFTGTAFGGGLGTAIFLMGVPGGDFAAALVKDDLNAPAADALHEMGTIFFVGAELSCSVFLAAVGIVILRTRLLPVWWGWLSLLVALWLLIGPIGWAALLFAFPVWTIVTSLMLLLWRPAEPVAQPAG